MADLCRKWSTIPKAAPAPTKQRHFTISRHVSPRGGFLFEIRSQRERTGESTADCADKTDYLERRRGLP